MSFQPKVNQELVIDGVTYRIAEHPAAPGMPYGQEGRAAIVYQIVASGGQIRALKVFKPRYRTPGLVALADRLATFAGLPGLQVCRRSVLAPQRHADLLRQHPDLTYAVLMPWVEGPTWTEALLEKRVLTAAESLALARALTEVLVAVEQRSLAHCDLSASNVMLPLLAGGAGVALVDVEGMYGSGLERPREIMSGSPGYAHKTAPEGLWGAEADRFAGAVLLAEMLGWCDGRVREAAWGENYFEPQEMQRDGDRYRLLMGVLQERWGEGVAGQFERAWRSETLADCATFGEWLVTLPEDVSAAETIRPTVSESIHAERLRVADDTLTTLSSLGQRLAEQGNLAGALEVYRQAQALAPAGSGVAQELARTVENLEAQRAEVAIVGAQPPERMPAEVEPVAAEPPPTPETAAQAEAVEVESQPIALRSAAEMQAELALTAQVGSEVREEALERRTTSEEAPVEVAVQVSEPTQEQPEVEVVSAPLVRETPDLGQLFADGLAAYERGDWARAKRLLGELVRGEPTQVRAKAMLADVEKRLAPPRRKRVPVWAWVVGGLGGLAILLVLLMGGGLLALLSGGLSSSTAVDPANTPRPMVTPWPTATPRPTVMAIVEPTNTPRAIAMPILLCYRPHCLITDWPE